MSRIVEQNLTTALIFEDDVDWDVRVRANLQRFALASQFLSENKEVLSSSSQYKIESVPNTETAETSFHRVISDKGIMEKLPSVPLSSVYSKAHNYPKRHHSGNTSPYGDPAEWDVLWIGVSCAPSESPLLASAKSISIAVPDSPATHQPINTSPT
jgi:hypothetical protein